MLTGLNGFEMASKSFLVENVLIDVHGSAFQIAISQEEQSTWIKLASTLQPKMSESKQFIKGKLSLLPVDNHSNDVHQFEEQFDLNYFSDDRPAFTSLFHQCFTSKNFVAEVDNGETINNDPPPRKRKTSKSVKKKTCRKCHRQYSNWEIGLRRHSIVHLRDSGDIDYIYQCLICKKKKQLSTSIHCKEMHDHLRKEHNIARAHCGQHFTNKTPKFHDLIMEEVALNFH